MTPVSSERGITLLEVMVSFLLMAVGMVAALGLLTVAVMSSFRDNEGFTTATTQAQNKLEELVALDFEDGATDTTVSPPASSGGTGLCGPMVPNTSCGSIVKGVMVEDFVDYLDESGQRLPSAASAHFMRQWQIRADSSARLKTISVRATQLNTFGSGPAATAVVTTLKADY